MATRVDRDQPSNSLGASSPFYRCLSPPLMIWPTLLAQTQHSFQQSSHISINSQRNQNATIMSHSQLPPTLQPQRENPTKVCLVRIIHTRRYPAYIFDAFFETASSTSGSQLTSSDKLSALPSHVRLSPVGRSATSLRMKSGTLEASELPSTSQTRLPSPPVLRAAPPITHSVSDSAVERETLSRQRVSFDSDRGSSISPRPSEHSPVVGSRARILACWGAYQRPHIPRPKARGATQTGNNTHANFFFTNRPSPVTCFQ